MRIKLSRRRALAAMLSAPFAAKAWQPPPCPTHYTFPRWRVNAMHQHLLHPSSNLVLIAAHRGLWRDTPENSETGIRNALARWEMLETDLRKTSDWQTVGDLAITHDADISRTTDGTGFLFNTTLAQLAHCRLLDRYGAVYQGGNCYPANSSGDSANDAVTGSGRHVMKFSQLLTVQQDFLSGTDAEPYGPILILDVKGAVEGDPEYTQPARGIFNTMNAAIKRIKTLSIRQRKSLIFMVKFNMILDQDHVKTFVEDYKAYNEATNPLPKLMIIINPEDRMKVPDADTKFRSWIGCTFLSHFEMNQYYLGDGCQYYIDYLRSLNFGISTYSENPFFPEGVWDNKEFRLRNIDFNCNCPVDFRELPDYTIANNGVGLVTSERPVETDALLRQYNLRNVPVQ